MPTPTGGDNPVRMANQVHLSKMILGVYAFFFVLCAQCAAPEHLNIHY